MVFDYSINLGHLMTMLSLMSGGIWFIASFRADIRVVVQRLGQFDAELKEFKAALEKLSDGLNKVAEILVKIARQEERLDAVDARNSEFIQRNSLVLLKIEERLRSVEITITQPVAPRRLPAKRKRKRA
jgi:hypothetical protein